MGIFTSKKEKDSYLADLELKSPSDILKDLLKATSGVSYTRSLRYSIFYNIVGFKGVKSGLGTSTIVANTAVALAELGVKVCVVDTSILYPCQDILLNTNYRDLEPEKRLDWFNLGLAKDTVLHISKRNNGISVLSFMGRTVVDMLGTMDTSELVELAFDQLVTKYDIILVDLCEELSRINTTAMQLCQRVIQVWGNAPHLLTNGSAFVSNNAICACPLEKCNTVITSKIVDDIKTDWASVFKPLGLNRLTSIGLSLDIARIQAQNELIWGYPSKAEDVLEFNNAILDIVCLLLSIDRNEDTSKNNEKVSTASSGDVYLGNRDSALEAKVNSVSDDFPEIGGNDNKTEVLMANEDNIDENSAFGSSFAKSSDFSDSAENLGGLTSENTVEGFKEFANNFVKDSELRDEDEKPKSKFGFRRKN